VLLPRVSSKANGEVELPGEVAMVARSGSTLQTDNERTQHHH